jgi:hypothetical protein
MPNESSPHDHNGIIFGVLQQSFIPKRLKKKQ